MKIRRRFWAGSALAAVSGFFSLLSLVWRDWVDEVRGWDPDQDSGALERGIVVALLVLTPTLAALRAERRRAAAT